jgi:hypothetical protein
LVVALVDGDWTDEGAPQAALQTHYDAHLYFANWGTR